MRATSRKPEGLLMSARNTASRVGADQVATSKSTCRVDLWATLTDEGASPLHGDQLLDEADRRWCTRQRRRSAQKQSLAAHILLRVALSDAVHGRVPPTAWRFERDDQGKLGLAPEFPELHFSLSHEHRLVVAAVSTTNPAGVDVVRLSAASSRDTPLWSAAAPAERALLLTESTDARAHDFARLWALKEAYTKMLGVGHGIDFALLEGDLAQRHLRQAERNCKVAFETHTLWTPDDDYFVALAVGTERATRIDTRGHLVDLTGGSWFRQAETSPHEAVWPKRWQWHWL